MEIILLFAEKLYLVYNVLDTWHYKVILTRSVLMKKNLTPQAFTERNQIFLILYSRK